jgi:3-dehydroquinate synthase
MGERDTGRIILIGFSTTGKSKVARLVAEQLHWGCIDLDEEITKKAGKTIPEIFAQEGEEHFRALERRLLAQACNQNKVVIASGGGAILDPRNRELMTRSGMVVCLEAKVETIYHRVLQDTATSGPLRPLLAVSNPLERIQTLKESRQPYYAFADWTVHTDDLTLEEVSQEVVRGWYYWSRSRGNKSPDLEEGEDLACEVWTAVEHYPVYVGWGLLENLGGLMPRRGLSGRVHIISDDTVSSLYGHRVRECLERSGFQVEEFSVPPGEATKSIDSAVKIYDFLVERKGEREDIILALGGGMIGDLAGFVAATFLRGLPLVHVPTSLIAMVDAAIGGKVAVNHPQGKNLIGAFYQPRMVVADVQALTTLPQRELASGWAEVVKHGMVFDLGFVEFLEHHIEELARLKPDITTEAIKRSAAIKGEVVSQDEKEKGKRTLLNYGHTIAHGLEAATAYQRFLHGEAVALGMMGAALLSWQLGLLSRDVVQRQRGILRRFGLPTACSDIELRKVLQAMELDKKVRGRAIRWVLLRDIGAPVIRGDVAEETVITVLRQLIERGDESPEGIQ